MSIKNSSSNFAILKYPIATIKFKLGNKSSLHEKIIHDSARYLLGEKYIRSEWATALNELNSNDIIPANKNNFKTVVGNNLNTTFGKWIYCCIRTLKPEHVIETGVAHGYSSWIILNAMHKNNKGTLYSIDLPNNDTNKDYNFNDQPTTGWMVPDNLKERWQMLLGDSKVILPKLLNELKEIDIFFHDSDHSYEHMQYEFEISHPFIKTNGLLISDDVHNHSAFSEHVNKYQLKALQFNKGGTSLKNK